MPFMGVEGMQEMHLDHFRKLLLLHKERLLCNTQSAFKQMLVSNEQTPADEADFAVAEVNQYLMCKIQARDRRCLLEIEDALSRLESGSYGHCVECGEPISIKRLEAKPFSSLCVDCQEDYETEQKRLA
jgi:DnaK suppressor protein